jgi:HD-like signal output (HDOD) protein/ActR/RegA family two-component response regulator
MAVISTRESGEDRRVLFVDDEHAVLDGLRDGLRDHRAAWQLTFADSGEAALAAFDDGHIDVLVTDLRMPGMNGADLLARVQELSPPTVRVVLSGYADTQAVASASTGAHRFLAKPYTLDELTTVLERSFAMAELSRRVELYRRATAASVLPSSPGTYSELVAAAADPAAGAGALAVIIERDPAMTAKVLQLANSAFFSTGRHVSRVREAVAFLGTDTITALAISAKAFAEYAPTLASSRFSIEEFQRHAALVARLAARITPDPDIRADAVTAGVLHDIGALVLLRDDRRRWEHNTEIAEQEGLPLHVVEQREQGVDHGAVGGYLLALWGLPHTIVEAVANHHEPNGLAGPRLDAVAAVHIAEALAHEFVPWSGDGDGSVSLLDADYVKAVAGSDALETWREFARQAAG